MKLLNRILCCVLSLSTALTPSLTLAADPNNLQDNADENSVRSRADDDGGADFNQSTVIGRGFLLHLACEQDKKLNGDFRVGVDGTVKLPYGVAVKAAGMRVGTFQDKVVASYKNYFKGTPNIRASVKEKRYWVKILGLVKEPGNYLLKENTTLNEALSLAGMRNEDIGSGYARINRGGDSWQNVSLEDALRSRESFRWQGGERIVFQLERPEEFSNGSKAQGSLESVGPLTRKILVSGEVRNPGGVNFQQLSDGYYYLLDRGGPTTNADLDNVEHLRFDRKSGTHKRVSLGSIAQVRNVQESDVLLVHAARPSKLERTLQTTALGAAILSAIALVVIAVK